MGAAVILALAAGAVILSGRAPRNARLAARSRSDLGLLALLTVATPIGLLLYSAVGSSLWLPRNLAASLPAFTVLAAAVTMGLAKLVPRPAGALAIVALVAIAGLNAYKSVTDDFFRRPAFREAARYVDRVAGSGDPVVEISLALLPDARLPPTTLDRYFERPYPLYRFGRSALPAWRRAARGRDVYLIFPGSLLGSTFAQAQLQPGEQAPADLLRRIDSIGGPGGRAIVRGRRSFPGLIPVEVARYRGTLEGRLGRRGGSEIITWTRGTATVTPGAAEGRVEGVSAPSRPLEVSGWALDPEEGRPVDWVLVFAGGRLVGVTAGGVRRPDIAAREGPGALLTGFGLTPSPPQPSGRAKLRVFAVVGERASELALSRAARQSLERRRGQAR